MNKFYAMSAAVLAAGFAVASPASAATLLGADVTGVLLYPTQNTPYNGQTPVTTTVGAGVEFGSGFGGGPGSFDIGANTITFATNYTGTYGNEGSFNGYRFDFAGRTITSLTLAQGSTFTPLNYTFQGNSVLIDVNGQSPNNGVAIFNVGVAGVPEPSTWAFMILGFGAMGFAMRRRTTARFAVVA